MWVNAGRGNKRGTCKVLWMWDLIFSVEEGRREWRDSNRWLKGG